MKTNIENRDTLLAQALTRLGLKKPWDFEGCVRQARMFASEDIPDALIEWQARQILNRYNEAIDWEIARQNTLNNMEEELRPIDRGGESGSHWERCRRWPWIAVWEDGYSCATPPWMRLGRATRQGHSNRGDPISIGESLSYCLEHSEHLPLFAPVKGWSSSGHIASNKITLPPLFKVDGRFIPRGILMQFKTARCGEALAYVFQYSGSPLMDEIRRLIISPSPRKVAEAYAIASSLDFKKAKTVQYIELEQQPSGSEESLSETDLNIANAIKTKQGVTGKEIAKVVGKSIDVIRQRLRKGTALYQLGYRQRKGLKGYFHLGNNLCESL